jgi:glycosyltransferase involved in cell wall biosynthesis
LLNAQIENSCFGRSPLTHLSRLSHVLASIEAYRDLPILVGSEFMRMLLHRNRIPVEKMRLLAPVLFRDVGVLPAPMSDLREILFVGRLRPEKGLRQLLRAVAPLSGEWKLNVAGEGPDRSACQDLTKELGIAQKVNFAGWLSRPEVDRLYERCACVVVPSLWPEPYGRTGPEAFMWGRPVVGFGVGGIVDWLEDGVTGYVVSPRDVAQLGHRIQQLLGSKPLREKMGQNARARALEMWSVDRHVDSLIRVLGQASKHDHSGQAAGEWRRIHSG